ncbi:unnamed protein product [Ambrosiozyma monospora]|uniref:Unnamed protein product n=1 Tax=Ambrosiozyma monospora TaxID=43982 RepID=A0ACB5T4J8_AMBMO|nr:unnamed protein product [Ambrosiozyma monospora]
MTPQIREWKVSTELIHGNGHFEKLASWSALTLSLSNGYTRTTAMKGIFGYSINPREGKSLKSNLPPNLNSPIYLTDAYGLEVEAKQAPDDITRVIKNEKSIGYKDIAVLLRLVKGKSFWELEEITLTISYLRVICSDFNWVAYRALLLSLYGFGEIQARDMSAAIRKLHEENGEFNVFNYIQKMTNNHSNKASLRRILQDFLNFVEQSRDFLQMDEHMSSQGAPVSNNSIQDGFARMFDSIVSTQKICEKIAKKKRGAKKEDKGFNIYKREIENNLEELKRQLLDFSSKKNGLLEKSPHMAKSKDPSVIQTSNNTSRFTKCLPSPIQSFNDDDIEISEVLSIPMKPCSSTACACS